MTRWVGMAHGIGRSRGFNNMAQCNMLEKILAVSVHGLCGGEVQRDRRGGEMREVWLGEKIIGRGDIG